LNDRYDEKNDRNSGRKVWKAGKRRKCNKKGMEMEGILEFEENEMGFDEERGEKNGELFTRMRGMR
jgi:hypothetical protein